MTTISITSEHKAKRNAIASDIAAFIAAGGKIEQIPYGPDEYSETATVDLNALKKEKARAKGKKKLNNSGKSKKARYCPTELTKKMHSQAVCTSPRSRARAKASGFKGEAA